MVVVFISQIPVALQDCVQPVSDGDDGAGCELCPDRVLDQLVRLQIHGSRSFVQDQDLRLVQQSSGETH